MNDEDYKLSNLDQFKNLLYQTYHVHDVPYYHRTNFIWDTHLVIWMNDDSWYLLDGRKQKHDINIFDKIITQQTVIDFLKEQEIDPYNIDAITEEIFLLFKIRYIL